MNTKPFFPLLLLALSACATTQTAGDGPPPVDVSGADVTTHTESNGDVIQEYRVGTLLRMVKVTPSRGPAYYLYDSNNDGRLDKSTGSEKQMPMTYWKIFSW